MSNRKRERDGVRRGDKTRRDKEMERAKTEEENTNEVKDRYHEVLAPYFFCFRLFFWGQF